MKTLELANKAIKRIEKSMSYILENHSKAPKPIQKMIKEIEKEFKTKVILYTPVIDKEWMIEPKARIKENVANEFIGTIKDPKIKGIKFSSSIIGNQFTVTIR